MEVIARIPRLHDAAGTDVERPSTAAAAVDERPAEAHVASPQRPVPAAPEACEPQPLPASGRLRAGRPAGGRGDRAALFSPSILVLATMAVAVWAAAWRNERLRALEQRPTRVAMEPPVMAGPERSLTP